MKTQMQAIQAALQTFKSRPSFSRIRLLALAIGAGALLTLLLTSFSLTFLEAYLYDLRVRLKGTRQTSEHIVMVTIDDHTLDTLKDMPPLNFSNHLHLLEAIVKDHPASLAYFTNFGGIQDEQNATEFVKEALTATKNGTPVWIGTDLDDVGDERVPQFPLSKIPHKIAIIHKDGTLFAEDKVTRRAIFSVGNDLVLHSELAAAFTGKRSAHDYRGVYHVADVDADYFLINYTGPTQEKTHPFAEYSALDVIQGKVSPGAFTGKIVLIGTLSKSYSGDFVYTPYSHAPFTSSKLTAHANIIETLIHNNAIVDAPKVLDILLTFILTSIIIGLVFKTSPMDGVMATALAVLLVFVAGLATFRAAGFWVHLSHPLMGIFMAYYLFVPYRLMMEYRSRWQFQKRAEVLQQVEELKGNFMNLITHDLKTPVARIHGMAEVLKSSGSDAKIVSEIINSTDELNGFINSILELARIESNKMDLTLHGRDVNKVIEDCVRKFEFQARARKIHLNAKLEPLFPIPIDTHLITKVVSNLLDNALKYSPEGSTVVVSSKESEAMPGYIEVSVTDNGRGIAAADLENLFSKFYRPKNDITIQTKGTGLGLYLSRYFVELHRGSLNVSSKPGTGSIFTILLPMEDDLSVSKTQSNEAKEARSTYV